MGQVIQVNGDYTIKARRAGGANVTFDTGTNTGSVTVTGDLHVLGTSHTFNTQVISDVVLVLNRGETGAGVTLRRSGIEIDRGSLDRAEFLFDESVGAWTVTTKDIGGVYSYTNSKLQLREILTDSGTDNGDLILIANGTGVVKVAGTTDYENRVIDHSKLPSVAIASISRSASSNLITVTTKTTHGIAIGDKVDIRCATFPSESEFNLSNLLVIDIDVVAKTFKYASAGADFPTTPVSGYVVKNSLVWADGSSYVSTDDYIPNMRAVSDYSRSLVNAALDNFSTSHIEDQNTRITVYDSETAGGTSYVKFTMDGVDRIWVDNNGRLGIGTSTPAYPLDVIATEVRIQSGTNLVKEYIGPQTNSGYLFGSTDEIGLKSDTTSGAIVLSKVLNAQYLKLQAGTGTSILEFDTAGSERMRIDETGKVFIGTTTGSSHVNISASNGYGGVDYAGLITLKNNVLGSTLSRKHIKISGTGDFEIANDANNASILKITDAGIATLINGLNVVDFISTPSTSFDLINTNALTVNFAGAGTAIGIGANTGTVSIHNPTLAVGNASGTGSSSSITTPSETFNFVKTNANTIDIGPATTGTLTKLNHSEVKIGNGTTSSITTPSATFNLLNDTATTVNFAGSGTLVSIGATSGSGTTHLYNDTTTIGTGTTSTVSTPSTTLNLANTVATTVNFAGAGTAISIGASTGTTTIHNPTLAVGSGTTSSITTPSTTFNLVNDTATTVNFANAATAINIGSALPGTTTIHHDLVVAGNITFNNGATQISSTVLTVDDPLIYLADNNIGDTVDIGFLGSYNNGVHTHTGFLRDASDSGTWKLFSGITAEPVGNVMDFTNAIYDNLKIGDLAAVKGVFSGDVSGVKGTFTGDVKVGSNLTIAASTGSITTTGNISTTGDLSAAKGTFTGKLTASSGADFTGGTVTGITAGMVDAYTKSETDNVATTKANAAASSILSGLESGSVTVNSSINLSSNATGVLPIANGGTGSNAATGTGKVVLQTSPSLITPALGVATATSINDVTITKPLGGTATLSVLASANVILGGDLELRRDTSGGSTTAYFKSGDYTVGYIDMPQVIKNSQDGPDLTDVGKHWFHNDSNPVTYYIDNINKQFPIGSVLTFINDTGAGDITINVSGASLVLAGTGLVNSLSVTLAADGIATAIKTTADKWLINGVGLTAV